MTTDPSTDHLMVGKSDPRLLAAGLALAERYKLKKRIVMDDARAAIAAADAVDPLRQPGHRVEVSGFQWTLQHPAECRPDMLACPMTKQLANTPVGALADGTYLVAVDETGAAVLTPEVDL